MPEAGDAMVGASEKQRSSAVVPPELPNPWLARLKAAAWSVGTTAVIVGAWEVASTTGLANPLILPPASEVGEAFVRLLQRDFFWTAVWVTLQATLIGFAIGCAGAWILGTLIALFDVVRYATYPLVVAFQNTPRVALAPLFVTWFGFGLGSKYVMAATICFFPLLIAVVVGMDNVNSDARALMRSFGASKWQQYKKLALPASLPYFFAGLKTAMTLALIGAIVGEFVGADEGLGVLIQVFNFQLNVAEGFACILALMIMGLLLYGIMELLDKKIIFWRGAE